MGMFGLEGDKKKKKELEFVFDFENEIADASKKKALMEQIEDRVYKVKEILRKGTDKALYDQLGILLGGYASLLKVASRIKTK